MYVSVAEREGPWQTVLVVDPATGLSDPLAFVADTDAGWYDRYVLGDNGKPKFNIETGCFIVQRVLAAFDLVDKNTGEVLAESK